MNNSSYEYEIRFNNDFGDLDLYYIAYMCDIDMRYKIFLFKNKLIFYEELELFDERIIEYLEEFENIRINEYSKWYFLL